MSLPVSCYYSYLARLVLGWSGCVYTLLPFCEYIVSSNIPGLATSDATDLPMVQHVKCEVIVTFVLAEVRC